MKGENGKMKSDLEQTEIEAPYELPESWKWCRLGDVGETLTGSTPSKKKTEYYGGNFPFFKPADLEQGINLFQSSEYLSAEGKKVSRIVPAKSTLICCIGSIGKSGYSLREGTTNQQINAIIPHKYIDSKYVFYAVNTEDFINQLWSKASSTTISIVNKSKMDNCIIPLPPTLDEQQRIVNRIESMFAKLDEAKEKAQNVVDGFETRKAAILHKAFTGELTAKWRKENGVSDDSWVVKTIGECGKWERGRSKHRPRNAPELFGGKYPFIQTGDIANADIYIYEHKQTLSEFGFQQSRLFPKDTLCITIAANIGKVAILTYDCCFPDSVVGFTPFENVDSKFMYYKINDMQKDLEAMAPATAQKNLNLKLLTSVSVQIPTFPEQVEIVRILDIIIEKETRAKEAAQTVLDQIALLKKSILARAFRGEL